MKNHLPAPDAEPFAAPRRPGAPATPMPGAWPLLGHAPALLRDPLALLASAGRLGPVTLARLGPVRAYLVTEPELIRAVLVRDAAEYDKGFQFDLRSRDLIGDGVGTSAGGARHRRNQKLLRPAFDHTAVDRYAAELAAERFLDARWAPAAGTTGKARRPILGYWRCAWSRTRCPDRGGRRRGGGRAAELLSGAGRRALLPIRTLERLPTPGNRTLRRSLAAVHAVAERPGDPAPRARGAGRNEDGPPTLLSILLTAASWTRTARG